MPKISLKDAAMRMPASVSGAATAEMRRMMEEELRLMQERALMYGTFLGVPPWLGKSAMGRHPYDEDLRVSSRHRIVFVDPEQGSSEKDYKIETVREMTHRISKMEITLGVKPETTTPKSGRKHYSVRYNIMAQNDEMATSVSTLYPVVINDGDPTDWLIPVKAGDILAHLNNERATVQRLIDSQNAEVEDIRRIGSELSLKVVDNSEGYGGKFKFMVVREDGSTQEYGGGNAVPDALYKRLQKLNSEIGGAQSRMESLNQQARLMALAPADHVLWIDDTKAQRLNFPIPELSLTSGY